MAKASGDCITDISRSKAPSYNENENDNDNITKTITNHRLLRVPAEAMNL